MLETVALVKKCRASNRTKFDIFYILSTKRDIYGFVLQLYTTFKNDQHKTFLALYIYFFFLFLFHPFTHA